MKISYQDCYTYKGRFKILEKLKPLIEEFERDLTKLELWQTFIGSIRDILRYAYSKNEFSATKYQQITGLQPSFVYAYFHLLEDLKLLVSFKIDRRRLYQITDKGKELIDFVNSI